MDRGACWATAHGVAESDTTEQLHFMIKKHRLLFLSHVFVAKLLKRYSVTVNLYFFTSLWSFLSNLAFFFFFQFGFCDVRLGIGLELGLRLGLGLGLQLMLGLELRLGLGLGLRLGLVLC